MEMEIEHNPVVHQQETIPSTSPTHKVAMTRRTAAARRKTLSDVTNLTNESRPLLAPRVAPSTNVAEYSTLLAKENTTLLKLVEERSKMVETSNAELRRVHLALQMAQQQNWELAQSNSRMLAEFNLGRVRLKELQHELGCTKAALRARTLELEDCKKLEKQPIQHQEKSNYVNKKPKVAIQKNELVEDAPEAFEPSHHQSGRKRALRTRSLGPGPVAATNEKKNVSTGRRLQAWSSSTKPQPNNPIEELFEIDVKLPLRSAASAEPKTFPGPSRSGDESTSKSTEKEMHSDECSLNVPIGVPRRSSLGRPLRRATEKVISYKERPVNIKMRRSG